MKRTVATIITTVTLAISGALYGAVPMTASTAHGGSPVVLAATTQDVTIQNNAYSPASLTVAQGTTVTWTNKDSTAHTVTSDSGTELNSTQFAPNQTYSHTFNQAGTFAYHCNIHPNMKATVTVTSSSSTQAQGTGTTSPSPQPQQSTTPQAGGKGAEGQSGAVATGPVEAGSGSTAQSAQRTREYVAIAGIMAFVLAAGLLLVRRFRLSHQ